MTQRNLQPFVLLSLLLVGVWVGGCASDDSEVRPADASSSTSTATDRVERAVFNKIAAELFIPLFWRADDNKNGAIDPDELAVLVMPSAKAWSAYVDGGAFTPAFFVEYQRIVDVTAGKPLYVTTDETERARQETLLRELRQGRPTLVFSDLTGLADDEKAMVGHVLRAARLIEELHAKQIGVDGMHTEIPADDTIGKAVFHRNQGPWCVAPLTENEPTCHALSSMPKRVSGLYPAAIQTDPKFCEMLEARPDQAVLMDPFVVVTESENGELTAVPYTAHYKDLMLEVAASLDAAASALKSDAEEPFRKYLSAAASSFRTNDWVPADEAWSRMNAENSRWYLRIGPDEVYFEPCARKAGFHVSFARINDDSIVWQQNLEPVKTEMENALAALAGAPYVARTVSFHLPDFIDIVVNAGDARSPHGATIGQSLPNVGPVANEGRGRTVAMTNLYTDDDSNTQLITQAQSLFCKETFAQFDVDPKIGVMSTVLHEAAHNLGPAHEYRVNGKTDDQVFGGPLASTMEELKSQTSSLYFAHWLSERGIITDDTAIKANIRDMVWASGHISRGMYTADGKPKPYSQLAAIQMGYLLSVGALSWRAEEKAANDADTGCLMMHTDKLKAAVTSLGKIVLNAKGAGDRIAADKLVAAHVDADDAFAKIRGVITERWLRFEKASFVYAVKEGATK